MSIMVTPADVAKHIEHPSTNVEVDTGNAVVDRIEWKDALLLLDLRDELEAEEQKPKSNARKVWVKG